jgi:hypothetical protein
MQRMIFHRDPTEENLIVIVPVGFKVPEEKNDDFLGWMVLNQINYYLENELSAPIIMNKVNWPTQFRYNKKIGVLGYFREAGLITIFK